jgi:hypothetical protein
MTRAVIDAQRLSSIQCADIHDIATIFFFSLEPRYRHDLFQDEKAVFKRAEQQASQHPA